MNSPVLAIVHTLAALLLAPLWLGLVEKTKARLAGRIGAPLVQPYRDLRHWVGRGFITPPDSGLMFRVGPAAALAAAFVAITVVPCGYGRAAVAFEGDAVLLLGMLVIIRGAMVAAALDSHAVVPTLSATRDLQLAIPAAPALMLALLALSRECGTFSLSAIVAALPTSGWPHDGPALALVSLALGIVLLCEGGRLPADRSGARTDGTLSAAGLLAAHGGVDLALARYAHAIKVWLLAELVVNVAVPWRPTQWWPEAPWWDSAANLAGMLGLAVVVGVIESNLARMRLHRVPQLLAGAAALAAIALLLVLVH